MTPLSHEYTRCKPVNPNAKCENCRRWLDHPEQTRGNGVVNVQDSKSKACFHVPISLQEKNT
jgi:hypothetical protein